MTDILSNPAVAKKNASALLNASDEIGAKQEMTRDDSTTVSGNQDAATAISLMVESTINFSEAVTMATSNLQTVASDFVRMDQEVASQNSIISFDSLS